MQDGSSTYFVFDIEHVRYASRADNRKIVRRRMSEKATRPTACTGEQ